MRGLHGVGFAISIHAPRGGSDDNKLVSVSNGSDFNPRSPWGERLPEDWESMRHVPISIHAPRGGSDTNCIVP